MRNLLRALALSTAALCPSAAFADEAKGDVAWSIVSDLTTQVGQRLAGSEAEARARQWAAERLKQLGFKGVAVEPFTITGYLRGEDKAELIAPVPLKMAVTALGYSGTGTIPNAELVYLDSFETLQKVDGAPFVGKVVFIDHAMKATQDGSSYGPSGQARRLGPALAAQKGAAAVLIRSIGTDNHRNPHTGSTTFKPGDRVIPAGAVSNPDADIIRAIAKSAMRPVRVSVSFTGKTTDNLPSGNVIGELPGRDPALPPVMVACHLDSWDLGTGAIDDAAGCAIITAAALKTHEGGKPLRTIRVLWAGAEELGGLGGKAYAEKHREPHALAMESDFGAGKVWRVKFRLADGNKALASTVASTLAGLGVVRGQAMADGGTDIRPVIDAQKLAVIDLDQDGTRYFDLHHTPDDTLDKVDPADLAQNVEAWARVLDVVANEPGTIAPAP